MLEKWLIVSLIAAAISGAAYIKGREHGAKDYYALVANLDRVSVIVKKATEKANTTRKEEKSRSAEIFAGLDLRLSNELPKITPLPNCAIPDADRVRLSDDLVRTANSAIGVHRASIETPPKEPATERAGLGKEGR